MCGWDAGIGLSSHGLACGGGRCAVDVAAALDRLGVAARRRPPADAGTRIGADSAEVDQRSRRVRVSVERLTSPQPTCGPSRGRVGSQVPRAVSGASVVQAFRAFIQHTYMTFPELDVTARRIRPASCARPPRPAVFRRGAGAPCARPVARDTQRTHRTRTPALPQVDARNFKIDVPTLRQPNTHTQADMSRPAP